MSSQCDLLVRVNDIIKNLTEQWTIIVVWLAVKIAYFSLKSPHNQITKIFAKSKVLFKERNLSLHHIWTSVFLKQLGRREGN